ncbi:MAG: C-terminal binding protein [Candidatus Dormibacteraceae bacterium]
MAVIDHRFPNLDPERAVLASVAAEVDDLRGLPDEEVLERAAEADGILLGARFQLTRDRIQRLRKCRVVVRYGVGVDNVDLDAAAERGIQVSWVPDYCVEEVSNHALAMLLSVHRQLPAYETRMRSGQAGIDSSRPIQRLSQATLGVVGFGRIGREVARKARAFGLRVATFDPNLTQERMGPEVTKIDDLDQLLAVVDAVSLHLPLSNQTRGIMNSRRLSLLKPGSMVINVGRGGLIDEEALADHLESGHLIGAGLDVTALEPLPPGHRLFKAPNLILTPHVAWYSVGAQRELQTKAAEGVARVLAEAA